MSPTGKRRVRKPPPPPTPRQPRDWDPPPPPATGDATSELTFAAIGRALTAWESFEISMSTLFARLLGIDADPLPATRAYGAIATFRSRLDMVRAAADAFFFLHPNDALRAEVITHLERARQFSARRNEIAHGIVRKITRYGALLPCTPLGPFARQIIEFGYAVVPPDYSTNKTELQESETLLGGVLKTPTYTYTSIELIVFNAKFSDLGVQTSIIAQRVFHHSTKF